MHSYLKTPAIFIVLFYLLAGGTSPVYAQEHSYIHYDTRDGLAGATIYCMAQDKEGFMWFGTETGLSRFDGTKFRNYTTLDGLPDNEIIKMFVDSKGRTWLIPFKNAVAFIWHGKIHNMLNDSMLGRIPIDNQILNVNEDRAGNIIFQANKLLYLLDTNGKFRPIDSLENFDPLNYHCVGINANGGFQIANFYWDHFRLWDFAGDKLIPVKDRRIGMEGTRANYIGPDLYIYERRNNLIAIGYKKGVFNVPRPKGFISVSRLSDSCIMFNTYAGAFLYNMVQRKAVDTFLQGQTVNGVICDVEGGIWFSTLRNGVFLMESKDASNYSFQSKVNNLGIFCIKKIDSVLYFGGDNYLLCKKDCQTGLIQSSLVNDVFSSGRARIIDIAKGGGNKLILGSDEGCLWLDKFGKKALPGPVRAAVKSFQIIFDTLVLVSNNENTRAYSSRDLSWRGGLYEAISTCSYRSKAGIYYIGTLSGLLIIDTTGTGSFPGNKDHVLKSRISCIQESSDGIIWLATYGGGLVGLRDGKILVQIAEKDGLTSNICRSLFVAQDAIWVGTDKGLNKVSRTGSGYRVTPYTISDGLNSDMINAVYVDKNEVYVGTPEGITSFDESKLSGGNSECILRFTDVNVSGNSWGEDTSHFILTHRNNNIRFDFVGISFRSTGKILYRYRLLGLDTTWRYTRENYLSYPSLPSGEYEIQLSAINKFGVRSELKSIKFSVAKLLWEKNWLRILLLLTIGSVIFFVFNIRVRRIRKKESEKAQIAIKITELEQMALRSQMNPHFIFNCLNSIQQFVIDRDVLGANEFITRFSFLIRQTLNFSTRSFITLEEEISYITTYLELEKKRFDNKFIYEIVVPENVDLHRCYIPPMILQPYIENAIRHGIGHRQDKHGKIRINMELEEGYLVCIVEDNGVGRKVAGSYKSINKIAYQSVGMSLVAKRMEMLNKINDSPVRVTITDLVGMDKTATGTRIKLQFPMDLVTG